ncbi:MAG: nuclear transport factor 2 family protein [Prochlorothrix sp.]
MSVSLRSLPRPRWTPLPQALALAGLSCLLGGITPVFAADRTTAPISAGLLAQARTADSAPAAVLESLSALDRAATAEDLDGVLNFYSRNFLHSDGWTRNDLRQSLSNFWERFSNLRYSTQLLSWQSVNGQIMTETQTTITGTETLDNRTLTLESDLRLRQYWEGDQIVREEVLGEQNQLQTGEAPPTLMFNLPEKVQVNETFNLDVIVLEPLEDDLLLGGFLDQPVRKETYLDPGQIDLAPIVSGGIFKIGRAPAVQDTRWVSAVIVRKGGMTFVTQRLQVVQ